MSHTPDEHALSELLREAADPVRPGAELGAGAWRAGRRRRGLAVSVSSGTSAAVVVGTAVLLILTSEAPSTSSTTAGQVRSAPCTQPVVEPGTTGADAVAGVCLPDPAPGFPVRLQPDAVGDHVVGAHPALADAHFRLAAQPERVEAPDRLLATGHEVDLRVARPGQLPPRDADPTYFGASATDHVVVRGAPATVYRYPKGGLALVVRAKEFDIIATGESGGATEPVSVEELTGVIDALQGVD